MALPLLNETPSYDIVIPSTGKKIKFRPYLVKEEKILLVASESKDPDQMMQAVQDTLRACTNGKLKVDTLTTFDLEYLFIKIRSRSVGETASLQVKCVDCGHENPYDVNLDDIQCVVPKKDKIVVLNDAVSVEMKYPSYSKLLSMGEGDEAVGFSLMASCLEAVITEDERVDVGDETEESIRRFLDSMTRDQFAKLSAFLMDIPSVTHKVEFDCAGCGKDNDYEIRGIQGFF
jgi:DNA-directed RNA polymerase subunit RPC12/RpoP